MLDSPDIPALGHPRALSLSSEAPRTGIPNIRGRGVGLDRAITAMLFVVKSFQPSMPFLGAVWARGNDRYTGPAITLTSAPVDALTSLTEPPRRPSLPFATNRSAPLDTIASGSSSL